MEMLDRKEKEEYKDPKVYNTYSKNKNDHGIYIVVNAEAITYGK